MAYTVDTIYAELIIPAESLEQATKALTDAFPDDVSEDSANDFEATVLDINGWIFEEDENGDTAFKELNFDSSWAEDVDLEVLETLSPFIKGEGYMQFMGEDASEFRVIIKNGKLSRETRPSWRMEYLNASNS